jgi:hypothetical protein
MTTTTRTYKGCPVVVVSGKPKPGCRTILLDPGVIYNPAHLWMGSWRIDLHGTKKRRTLYIQKKYLDALRRAGPRHFHKLRYTLEHEYIESKIAEQSLSNLERVAHRKTIRRMHPTYSNPFPMFKRMERKELKELGLSRYI